MRMENFTTEFVARKFWPYVKPDYFNNTAIRLDGKLVWPIEGIEEWETPPAMPKPGVAFRLEIPSGTLTGTITEVVDLDDICEMWQIADCVWVGKFAGLAGGMCGNGWFRYHPRPETTVQTSIAEEVLTYAEYAAVRRFAETAARGGFDEPIWLSPEANQALLRSALEHLRALRKEAERLAAE